MHVGDIDFHHGRLHDRTLEEWRPLVACRVEVAQNISCSRGLAEERNVIWIAAEIGYEVIDPFKSFSLVTESCDER